MFDRALNFLDKAFDSLNNLEPGGFCKEFEHGGPAQTFATEYFIGRTWTERLALSSQGRKHAWRVCVSKSQSLIPGMWEDTVASGV